MQLSVDASSFCLVSYYHSRPPFLSSFSDRSASAKSPTWQITTTPADILLLLGQVVVRTRIRRRRDHSNTRAVMATALQHRRYESFCRVLSFLPCGLRLIRPVEFIWLSPTARRPVQLLPAFIRNAGRPICWHRIRARSAASQFRPVCCQPVSWN